MMFNYYLLDRAICTVYGAMTQVNPMAKHRAQKNLALT